MSAITNLIEQTAEMNKCGLSSLQDTINEISGIGSTIEALLDAAVDIQDILLNLIILRVDLVLPSEPEKLEAVTKKDGIFPPHNIINYTINIGPFNFSPLGEMLGDTFSDFETQTSSIAEIYAPCALSGETMTSMTPIQMPEIIDLSFARDSGIEESRKKAAPSDIYSPIIQNKLYNKLKGSAPIINELTTISERIAQISIAKGEIQINQNLASALPDTLQIVHGEQKEALRPEVQDNLNYFSEMVGNISTSIRTKISEVQNITEFMLPKKFSAEDDTSNFMRHAWNSVEDPDSIIHSSEVMENFSAAVYTKIADIQSLNNLSTNSTQLTGLLESKEHSEIYSAHKTVEISDHIRELSDIAQNISTSIMEIFSAAVHTRIADIPSLNSLSMNATKTIGAYKINNIQAQNNISPETPISSGSKKNDIQTIQYPDQKIIEIPSFAPHQKFMMPTQEAAINAKNLSYAIGSNHGKGSISGNYPSAQILTAQSTTAPTNMFEALSNYMTIASQIDNQMSAMAQENIPGEVSSPLNLLKEGHNLASAPHLNMFASGKNGGFITEDMATNIAVSMAATDSLNNIGSSAIKSISTALPPSGSNFQRFPDASVPHSIENIIQFLTGAQKETSGVSQVSSGAVNFHNSFNITVNVKGGSEETDVKDLGRKIGQILSDEIKRYGGKRWI